MAAMVYPIYKYMLRQKWADVRCCEAHLGKRGRQPRLHGARDQERVGYLYGRK